MRRIVPLLLAALLATPAFALDIDIRLPDGGRIYVGDRGNDGRYWDGRQWRDEAWWRDNCPRFEGRRDFRGRCEPVRPEHGPKGHFCPPGQAKKGNC